MRRRMRLSSCGSREVLLPALQTAGLAEAATLEWSCLPAVAAMELHGIGIDQAHLTTLGQQLAAETAQAATALTALLHPARETETIPLFAPEADPINLDSPTQLLQALQRLGVPVTSTASWSTDPPGDRPSRSSRRCWSTDVSGKP